MASLSGSESDPLTPGVHGTHGSSGPGLRGESEIGPGVHGISRGTDPNEKGIGVWGQAIGTAVAGESSGWVGVFGATDSTTGGAGVWGRSSTGGVGVNGESAMGPGVMGTSTGTDPNQMGVGVFGKAIGTAIVGESNNGFGLFARTQTGEAGVRADHAGDGVGVHGSGAGGTGVLATSSSGIGLLASTENGEAAIRGDHHGSGFAGVFNGPVLVTRDLQVRGDVQLVGADLAEEFTVDDGEAVEPGCVVVLAGTDRVTRSGKPYDRRVAGVVSGAGSYRPALVLDRRPGASASRWPLALAGKVWCWVDADFGPVALGDPLTTSATPATR